MVWAKRSSSCANHAGHAADGFQQFGISLAHLFGHLLRHLEKEWPLQAQHAPVAHGAANDLAQHVAAAFVRGHHAVADQERRGAAVVGDDAQRSVGLRRRAIRFAGKLAGKVDQRPEKVRVVDAGLSLQNRGQPLEARACVDGGLGQRRDVSRGVAIELHEYQIPDLHVASAVAAELAIRVAHGRKPRDPCRSEFRCTGRKGRCRPWPRSSPSGRERRSRALSARPR